MPTLVSARSIRWLASLLLIFELTAISPALQAQAPATLAADEFRWTASPPLVTPRAVDGLAWHAIKDPSVVRVDGRWHLFATVRGSDRSHAIVYLSFDNWDQADRAEQHVLSMHPGYFCAPQVFWFAPQQRWYLICQASSDEWGEPAYRPAFSTTTDITDPDSWSPLSPLYDTPPGDDKAGLDFWVICDAQKAHLFYTSLDGRMWRTETGLSAFPLGWGVPQVVLRDDIFEASHTYRVKDRELYLTVVEAQNGFGWRYYKAYTAPSLDGHWTPLAATREDAFASLKNVVQPEPKWTDAISHIELIRSGYDQRLEVDLSDLQLVFQGARDAERRGKAYGEIPWRLGLLSRQK